MTVSVQMRLSSDTIHVPEAAPLVGKNVRITIVEDEREQGRPDLSALERIAGKIELDWDAVDDLRRRSIL